MNIKFHIITKANLILAYLLVSCSQITCWYMLLYYASLLMLFVYAAVCLIGAERNQVHLIFARSKKPILRKSLKWDRILRFSAIALHHRDKQAEITLHARQHSPTFFF